MLHEKSGASLATGTAPTSTPTRPNVAAIFAQVADADRMQRQRRARALLEAAEQLAHRYPESARLARLWAGEAV